MAYFFYHQLIFTLQKRENTIFKGDCASVLLKMEPFEVFIGVATFIFVFLSLVKLAKCNDDIVAEKMEGNRENSELYVIGENMYLKERKYKDFYLNVFRSWAEICGQNGF